MQVERTVDTHQEPARVFAYLADFTTTTEWDAGTVETTRISGTGGVGTRYHNVSVFRGRETELVYEVLERVEGSRIRLRGENRTVVATDTIEVTQRPGGGARVVYRADFRFQGLATLAAPFLRGDFRRLGDDSAAELDRVLNGEGGLGG